MRRSPYNPQSAGPDSRPPRRHPQGGEQQPVPAKKLAGDALEKWLTERGITKTAYQDFKAALGLPPTCGCSARQRWLNQAHQFAIDKGWLSG